MEWEKEMPKQKRVRKAGVVKEEERLTIFIY